MSKEDFIKFCINNNYTYTETPSEIMIDQIIEIDGSERSDSGFSYHKDEKSIFIYLNDQGCREVSDIEYQIFINLKSVGDRER